MQKLIITAAIIGNTTTREQNPNVPLTPREISDSAIECFHAGAAICHIHVRDPRTHQFSHNLELFQEVFDRIREKCDMIINLSTGHGCRLLYNPEAHDNPWDTSLLMRPEERVAHILKLKPELCSLNTGSLNFGNIGVIHLVPLIEKEASLIKEVGTKPELECYDLGHIPIGKHLINKGLIEKPPIFQLVTGLRWAIEAKPENIVHARRELPSDAVWYALGIGRHQFPVATTSIIMGGNVRVGFEDNIYIRKNVLAKSNAQMVRKIIKIAEFLDREVASVKETREILGLKR